MKSKLEYPAAAGLFVAAIALLYGGSLTLWWTYDDFFNLHHSLTHPPGAYLFDPSLWREMPNKLFTPLQMLSYEVDLSLFGLRPAGFLAHQLIVLAACSLALFVLMRLWFSATVSFGSVLLFLTGVPVSVWAHQIMVRHYVEGLFFAVLAAILFVIAVRNDQRFLGVAAAICYLLAALAKEVYVPLPLLLAFLPEGRPNKRVTPLLPMFCALGGYLAWRFVMLGTLVGGYGWAMLTRDVPMLLAQLPLKTLRAIAPLESAAWAVGIVVVATLMCAIRRSRSALLFVVISSVFVLLPFVPVSKVYEARFAGLAWLFITFSVAACAQRLSGSKPILAFAGFLIVLVGGVILNRVDWRTRFEAAVRMSEEGRFFMRQAGPALLRHPRIPPAALSELKWLRDVHDGRAANTTWFYDDFYLCANPSDSRRTWQFDPSTGVMQEISDRIPSIRENYCGAIRWSAPLSATFHKKEETLFWQLGPYADGKYSLLLNDGESSYDVPAKEGFQIGALPALSLRVRYQSAEGWITYSPQLNLDFQTSQPMSWRR